ncbi:MAG TPA: M57 family metalloprotease [Myxococcaceae bacterium]|jgi:hypothetical protein
MRIQLPLLAAAVFALVSCAPPASDPTNTDTPMSWEEFQGLAYQEPDTGIFVMNGDEIHEDLAQLRTAYDKYVSEFDVVGTTRDNLCVNRVGSSDDKWSSSVQNNITYCVSSSSFGSRYNSVVSAMASAGSAWHSAANVTLVHVTSADSNCSRSTTSVVFNVRQVNSGGQYLARAFFPSTSRSGREVLIDSTAFGSISPYTLAGILRHELGHTLGFRHEHTRPEAGTCFENSSWRALTTYDSASVMHYPQCNGSNNGDLNLTTKDKSGAKALYP